MQDIARTTQQTQAEAYALVSKRMEEALKELKASVNRPRPSQRFLQVRGWRCHAAKRRFSMEYDDFTAFEHRGWEHLVQPYENYFGQVDRAVARRAARCASVVGDASRMLDVATGPGTLAAAAIERGATVSGIDFSAAMIAHARQTYPEVEFQVASADQLPFNDESFDAVGISLRHAAFPGPRSARSPRRSRVLRQGGRVAFTVWAAPEKAIGFQMVLKAVEMHGRMDVALPAGPPFFRFSDPDESKSVLTGAGFADPQVIEVEQTWHIVPPETPFHSLLRGGVRMSALLNAQEPPALLKIEQGSEGERRPLHAATGNCSCRCRACSHRRSSADVAVGAACQFALQHRKIDGFLQHAHARNRLADHRAVAVAGHEQHADRRDASAARRRASSAPDMPGSVRSVSTMSKRCRPRAPPAPPPRSPPPCIRDRGS